MDARAFSDELSTIACNIEYGVKALLSEGITERALFLLIQHASPIVTGEGGRPKKPTIGQIRAVMQGLDNLYEFCFGKEGNDAASE